MNRHLGDVAHVHIPERRMHEYCLVFVVTDFAMGDFDRFVGLAQEVFGPIAKISIVIRGRDAPEVALNFRRCHIQRRHWAANDAIVDILHGRRDTRDDQNNAAQGVRSTFVSQHDTVTAARHRKHGQIALQLINARVIVRRLRIVNPNIFGRRILNGIQQLNANHVARLAANEETSFDRIVVHASRQQILFRPDVNVNVGRIFWQNLRMIIRVVDIEIGRHRVPAGQFTLLNGRYDGIMTDARSQIVFYNRSLHAQAQLLKTDATAAVHRELRILHIVHRTGEDVRINDAKSVVQIANNSNIFQIVTSEIHLQRRLECVRGVIEESGLLDCHVLQIR